MGSKTKSSNKVDPWIPNQEQVDLFRGLAQGNMTPEMEAALRRSGSMIDRAAGMPQYAPGVQGVANRLMGAQPTVQRPQAAGTVAGLQSQAQEAMNASTPQLLQQAAQRAGSQGVNSLLQQEARQAANQPLNSQFQSTLGQSANRTMDAAFNRQTNQAMNPQYASGFQRTMNQAMDPNARSAAWDQVKANVVADIMPDINATFGASGMTGSSAHQQQLTKGLSAGIANVENQAWQQGQDRAMQAANTSQQALMDNRQLGLNAAGMRQDASNAIDASRVNAATGLQNAGFQQQQLGLQAGQALEGAQVNRNQLGLQAGQALQGANAQNAQLGLQGAQALQDQANTRFGQQLAGAQFQQGQVTDARNAQLQGAGLMNDAFGQNFARQLGLSQAYQGLGGQYQGVKDNGLSQWLGAATGGASRTQTQQQNPGLMGILGAGLQIASLFSDERLKEDIKEVGELKDGTPVYTYKYKAGVAPELEGKTLMGVMAQEVKRKGAVEKDPSGFKRVNYGKL